MNIIVTYLSLALLLSLGSEEQTIVCRNLFKKISLNLAEKKKKKKITKSCWLVFYVVLLTPGTNFYFYFFND